MEKSFEDSGDLTEASRIYTDKHRIGMHEEQNLLPLFLQYKMWDANRKLVYATWGLALVTIVLAIITYSAS